MTDGAGQQAASPGSALADEPAVLGSRSAFMRGIDAVGWRQIRLGVLAIYVAALVVVVVLTGVPTGRQTIAVIIVAGLAISTIGQGWRRTGLVLVDWLPFTLVLMAYDKTRGVADTVGLPIHEGDVVTWEKWLCFGHVPTVWLQQRLLDVAHVHWYDGLFTLIYTSHFLATPILAAVLWLVNRQVWKRYIWRVIVLSVAGLATYILFPEAPPWLASRDGYISEHIFRLSARGWIWLHVSNLQTVLDHAQVDGANPIAAMPSLHAAFACLFAIFLGSRLRTRWRYLLVLYPLAMGLALVYQGEHYVIDLLAGVAYALAVHFGMNRWERWRSARRAASAPPELAPAADVDVGASAGAVPGAVASPSLSGAIQP